MNIQRAKEQIVHAIKAYFTKNPSGDYVLPIEAQRPIFLMGPPGIGKTAIMEQIASELDVAIVSYSMTHHTRQSALGLPFITKKIYGGKEYAVSEYTMSEIIATIYDTIEETGKKEGILFLDEINCVSETLAPIMLQFLQYKVFGRHRVPEGWIVVTAGNPPEYNNSVREYDIVTWDRLKRVDVEPDYNVWKTYAVGKGVHPAIISYLDLYRDHFYQISNSVDGKQFVTARGWVDLSDMLRLYEINNIPADIHLVKQYLQDPKIGKEFAVYLDLFNKYRSDYQIEQIMAGKAGEDVKDRAKNAKFDERLALLSLLLDGVGQTIRSTITSEAVLLEILDALKNIRSGPNAGEEKMAQIQKREQELKKGKKAANLSRERKKILQGAIAALEEMSGDFAELKQAYDIRVNTLKKDAAHSKKQLSHVFRFCEEVFGEGQEILILVTELTARPHCARFISRYGCEEYFAHNKELLFYERQSEIIRELDRLDLD